MTTDPSCRSRLTPYHWNAPRSRLDYVKAGCSAVPQRQPCPCQLSRIELSSPTPTCTLSRSRMWFRTGDSARFRPPRPASRPPPLQQGDTVTACSRATPNSLTAPQHRSTAAPQHRSTAAPQRHVIEQSLLRPFVCTVATQYDELRPHAAARAGLQPVPHHQPGET